VYGPYDPARGHRFNHNKLLIDPYAKQLNGNLRWTDANFGYRIGAPRADLSFDRRDNAAAIPKCVVVDTAFSWGDERVLQTSWSNTIIYELHVRGFSMKNSLIAPELRGTFAALGSPANVEYLNKLGITAVELLPVHAFADERTLVEKGLRNYWGYNTIGFFAPEPRYLSAGSLAEFKTMVKRLHEAGIEVLLDVVYNHTAEGNQLGPTLSFRGIDNASYYRLGDDPRYYVDYTGCGNTLRLKHPRVMQLVTDSLRYWVEEMHVDGFRFDLAPAIVRRDEELDWWSSGFMNALLQDPVLARVKLIAEPWDLGPNGYQLGHFPPGWSEWNDKYRSTVRRFWKGDDGLIPELASRLTGSSDIFDKNGRQPRASINFVTAHDGFTLTDLVSYDHKHNEANLDENKDGSDNNESWNCGVEGPTDDPDIRRLREQQKRNMLAMLLLSEGTPMLLAGDEFGNTQLGNNNAYCQDNELGWLGWQDIDREGSRLIDFVRRLIALRRAHPVFRRTRFFRGAVTDTGLKDVTWIRSDSVEMQNDDWHDGSRHSLGALFGGEAGELYIGASGYPEFDSTFLILMNAGEDALDFVLPKAAWFERWELVLDSAQGPHQPGSVWIASTAYHMAGRSLSLFTTHPA